MRATINNIYQHSKTNNTPLLGSNSFDFWQAYAAAFNVYDRYFRDKFLSWFYWMNFDETATIENIYDDFVDAVQAHLTINSKRYSELYRVQVLAATAYDIVNNYDLNETHTATRSDSATDVSGARSDSKSGSTVFGSHTDSKSGSNTSGAREDTQSGSATDGARQDSSTTGLGAQTNTTEKQIEGFNSNAYTDADKTIETTGARSDTTTENKGAQTNTTSETLNKGEQIDSYSDSMTIGGHTDSISENTSKGSQTDTHTGSATESISIRRYGNIGVQTAADVIGGHIRLWETFNFYKMVFDEIAKDFLLLDQCYDTDTSGTITNESLIMEELKRLELKIDATAKSSELAGLAKTSDLTPLAKSSELAGLAKSSELATLATKTDLNPLAKSSELAGLAKTSDLSTLATSAEVGRIELSVEALRASTLSYKNDIINSIEGVSSEEY